MHEEHAVAIAHGYARVTGRPMAVALHANVGLMHATMAIFNAWCDRIPIFMLGGVGPMDAVKRRPWVDWIHTSRDLGALIRGYVKWDDQPGSIAAALESMVRAYRIATTAPLRSRIRQPRRHDPGGAVAAARAAACARSLPACRLRRPAGGRGAHGGGAADPGATAAAHDRPRVQRSARLSPRACSSPSVSTRVVLTDLKTGASFPTQHRLHPHAPGLYVSGDAGALIREADVIVSLDWIDLAGSLRQACGGEMPAAKIVQCSVDQYSHHGWNMDYQSLPPTDVSILSPPDRLVAACSTAIDERAPRPTARGRPRRVAGARPRVLTPCADTFRIDELAHTTVDTLAPHRPSYIRLPLGWPGEYCRFEHPQDYIGFDGGGGIGSGPGMAVGAALALRGSDRLPVAILGDGDYLMGLTALWTGVHNRVPLLVIVANNQSFFNDELHQERVARTRGRPIENRWIGLRMDEPAHESRHARAGPGRHRPRPGAHRRRTEDGDRRRAWRECATARCA